MILLSMILPAAGLCLALLYAGLLRRFFRVRSELPVLGLREGARRLAGKRGRLAALGVLFFALCFLGQLWAALWSPAAARPPPDMDWRTAMSAPVISSSRRRLVRDPAARALAYSSCWACS